MRISIIGTGYVGSVTAACFAEAGHDVVGLDVDPARVRALSAGETPLFEPGLKDLLALGLREKRLRFTTEYPDAVRSSDIIFLAVDTPSREDGAADLSRITSAAESVARCAEGRKLVVVKSTVPVGTTRSLGARMRAAGAPGVSVAFNPEFLKEGSAVADFQRPDRIIVGTDGDRAFDMLRRLYDPFVRTGAPILRMDIESAELTKYASNAFLATRISFMNEIARLCEKVGADVEMVRRGMGYDPRIGNKFLFAGIGFGGSCFPKDLRALTASGRSVGIRMRIAEAALAINEEQKLWLLPRLRKEIGGSLKRRTVAIWGLAFKPRTDDLREAPAVAIIRALLEDGAVVRAFDPVAGDNARRLFGDSIEICDSQYEAARGADALILATEWAEFRSPDMDRLAAIMRGKLILDGRNVLDPAEVRGRGFVYIGIGRP
ncbi:MAG: UDP-glucose/GDP-mannose dehydrogenase family protein [Planctomycetota bacterium]|nr:UDP-glucose/GDP-mannose dehydrogenase family protein [Planctomycetota bacterium]